LGKEEGKVLETELNESKRRDFATSRDKERLTGKMLSVSRHPHLENSDIHLAGGKKQRKKKAEKPLSACRSSVAANGGTNSISPSWITLSAPSPGDGKG